MKENRERWAMNRAKISINDFWRGVVAGIVASVIIFTVGFWLAHLNKRDKELIEYAERQMEIELLREDIINRPADEFLEVPDIRRAADGAAAEFDRKRDEAVQPFRGGYSDR
jgi:hypothetical protein